MNRMTKKEFLDGIRKAMEAKSNRNVNDLLQRVKEVKK